MNQIENLPIKRVMASCRLCLKVAALRDSHVIPAWAYRRAREESLENPNPVLHQDGRLVQTSKQITAPLLCDDCENDLSADENYVSTLAFTWEKPGLILQKLVEPPLFDMVIGGYRRRLYNTKDLDVARMTRFALSVFWRSAIAKIRGPEGARLGPKYEESFRLYLAAHGTAPAESRLTVAVLDPTGPRRFHGMIAYPWSFRGDDCWHHRFLVWGLVFDLYLGQTLPAFLAGLAFDETGRVLVLPGEVVGAVRSIAQSVQRAEPSAKLASNEAAYREAGRRK